MNPTCSSRLRAYLPAAGLAGLAGFAALLLFAPADLRAQAPAALPPGDGAEVVAVACTQCHALRVIRMLRFGAEGWQVVVNDMVLRGAQLLPQESATVVQYLARNFGPGSNQPKASSEGTGTAPAAAAREPNPVSLPAGPGKELVESRCTACHELQQVTSQRLSKQQWENTVKTMVERGLSATPEEIQTLTSYLASQFGTKTK